MKQLPKKVIDFDDLMKEYDSKKSKKEELALKYKKSLDEANASDNDAELINKLKLKTGYYSLRTKIIKNPWVNSRPASKATEWLFKEVFKNQAEYKYSKRLLYQGGLFIFEYKNPKYKGTSVLPWFDKYPLVISLGPVVTNLGVRNLGFNLHLLPPKIRIVALCKIFELYKKLYRYQIFYKQDKPVQIKYKYIVHFLDKYGIRFCVRMYIPSRMSQIVKFPLKTWHKAIFVPSRGYDSIKANKLIVEWKKYCKENNHPSVENINWQSNI